MMYQQTSGGDVGKVKRERRLALRGRESYLLFYKIISPLTVLNIFSMLTHGVAIACFLPGTQRFFAKLAFFVVILTAVFTVWLRPSVEFYWETARTSAEKGRHESFLSVRLYHALVGVYQRIFIRYSKAWSCLTLALGIFMLTLGNAMIFLVACQPKAKFTDQLAKFGWTLMLALVILQVAYCLLMHRTISVLTEEDGGTGR